MHGISEHHNIRKGSGQGNAEVGRLSAEGVGHRGLVRPRVFRHVDVAVGGAADVAAEIVLFAEQLATEVARDYLGRLGL